MSNQEIVDFIQDAAIKRGINPWIACAVASTEGGLSDYAAHGDFETGDSWWPFQLHYGGPGYEQYGTTPGMGNGFTALTGWQPGDEAAWQDSVRYALNRAKRSGWGAWYGAAGLGLVGMEGVSSSPWNANAEVWDFERGHTTPAPGGITYDAMFPAIPQNDPWSCGPTSTRWAMWSVGRHPTESWIESQMIAEGVANPDVGVTDATGAGIAAFINEQYGEFGYSATNKAAVSFDDLVATAGNHPILIGGRAWEHWSGLRSVHESIDLLLLANPAEGWKGVGQTMTRDQFQDLGTFSCVHITHPVLA